MEGSLLTPHSLAPQLHFTKLQIRLYHTSALSYSGTFIEPSETYSKHLNISCKFLWPGPHLSLSLRLWPLPLCAIACTPFAWVPIYSQPAGSYFPWNTQLRDHTSVDTSWTPVCVSAPSMCHHCHIPLHTVGHWQDAWSVHFWVLRPQHCAGHQMYLNKFKWMKQTIPILGNRPRSVVEGIPKITQ